MEGLKPRSKSFYNSDTQTREYWEEHPGNPLHLVSTLEVAYTEESRTMSGWDIPNFHARKKAGELLPFTPFAQTTAQWKFSESRSVSKSGHIYQLLHHSGAAVHSRLTAQDDLVSYMNEVEGDPDYFVQAAASKIYSSGWDSLTFIAELTKTVAMFKGFVRRLISLALRGRLDKIWLEGRYGWRTLVYDMVDINNALANIDSHRKRFRESVGTNQEWSVIHDHVVPLDGLNSATYRAVDTILVGLRGTVAADIEPPTFQFNPFTTAWELIGLSFVVDWVINVGQFLESMSFLVVNTKYTAAAGMYGEMTRVWSVPSTSASGGYTVDFVTVDEQLCFVTRTVRTPATVSKSPLLQLRLDGFKVMDLVAILLGRLVK